MKRIFALAALLLAGVVHGQAYKQFYPGCALTGTWDSQTVHLDTGACIAGNLPPTNLNSGTSASSATFWRGDGTWATPPGTGGGTVNSVALTAPSVFSVGGSPITNSGTLALTFATGQTANEFLATPDGTTGAVGLRAIVAGDLLPINLASSANGGVTGNLPVTNLNAGTSASSTTFWRGDGTWATPSGATGTVSSVALSDGSTSPIYSISGSPVTTTGTLTFTLATEAAHFALLGPTSGSPAQPTFRAIAGGDLPAINLAASGAGGVTGNLPVGNLNSGTSATGSTFWRGDGTWAVPPGGGGTVTSVAQTVPAGFAISGSPITGAGILGISYATGQSANLFLATPNGTTGALSERAIVGADLPAINLAASGAGGVTGNLSVNNLNGGTSAGSTTFWRGDGSWATPAYPTGANPSTSVGLSIVNGSAATFMRSDGAPALSQAIAPTWTGLHTFTPSSGTGAIVNAAATSWGEEILGDAGVTAFTGNTKLGLAVGGSTSTNDYSGIDFLGNIGIHARVAILSTGGGSTMSFGTSANYTTGITNTALSINPAGGVTIAAPTTTSTGLTVSGIAASRIAQFLPADSASVGIELLDPGANASDLRINSTNSSIIFQANGTSTSEIFQSSGGTALTIAPTRALTIAAPTASTTALTVNGVASITAEQINTASDNQLMLNATSGQYSTLAFANAGSLQAQEYWDNTNSKFFIGVQGGDTINISTGNGIATLSNAFEGAGTINANAFFANAVPVPTETHGTFTCTLTGFTTTVTQTCSWDKVGNLVVLGSNGSAFVGTSNSTSMTLTGLPSAIEPTVEQQFIVSLENNSANIIGYAQIAASSLTVTFGVNPGGAVFTASGGKGLPQGFTFSYKLN